jgi:hypothetical protein
VLYLQHRGLLYKTFYKTRPEVRGLKHNTTKAFPPHQRVRSSNNCSFCSYDVLPTINSLSNTILTKKCIKFTIKCSYHLPFTPFISEMLSQKDRRSKANFFIPHFHTHRDCAKLSKLLPSTIFEQELQNFCLLN